MSDPRPALAAGRVAHAALMLDACTVTRGGTRTFDRATQTYTITGATQIYAGPCRFVSWLGREEEAAETEVAVRRYKVQFPLDGTVPEIRRLDTVSATSSSHPWIVGAALTVTEPEFGSTSTALTVIAELAP